MSRSLRLINSITRRRPPPSLQTLCRSWLLQQQQSKRFRIPKPEVPKCLRPPDRPRNVSVKSCDFSGRHFRTERPRDLRITSKDPQERLPSALLGPEAPTPTTPTRRRSRISSLLVPTTPRRDRDRDTSKRLGQRLTSFPFSSCPDREITASHPGTAEQQRRRLPQVSERRIHIAMSVNINLTNNSMLPPFQF